MDAVTSGINGNEQASRCARHEPLVSLSKVAEAKEAREVWQDPGLEDMEDYNEDPRAHWDAVDSATSEKSDEGGAKSGINEQGQREGQ